MTYQLLVLYLVIIRSVNAFLSFIQSPKCIILNNQLGEREIEGFEKISVEKNGLVVKNCKNALFDSSYGSIRGLIASNALSKGERIISLPVDSCLLVDSSDTHPSLSAEDPSFSNLYRSIEKLPYRLSLLLLNEWKKGISSKFVSYINILPFLSVTPIHWSVEMMRDFPYLPFTLSVTAQNESVQLLYSQLKSVRKFADMPYERLLWAVESVASRAFESNDNIFMSKQKIGITIATSILLEVLVFVETNFPVDNNILEIVALLSCLTLFSQTDLFRKYVLRQKDQKICVLLPFIDFANHDGITPNCELDVNTFQDHFILKTNREISSQEQIKLSYGRKSNDHLVQYFGFIENGNLYEKYYLSDFQEKLQFILQNENNSNNSNCKEEFFQKYSNDQRDASVSIESIKNHSLLLTRSMLTQKDPLPINPNIPRSPQILNTLFLWERELLERKIRSFLEKYSDVLDLDTDREYWIRQYFEEKLKLLRDIQMSLSEQ